MEKYLVKIFWQNILTRYFGKIYIPDILAKYFLDFDILAKGLAIDPDMNQRTFLQPFIINQSSLDLAKYLGYTDILAKCLVGGPQCFLDTHLVC